MPCCVCTTSTAVLDFVHVPAPSTEEEVVLVEKRARRAEGRLCKQGYENNEDSDVDESDALPLFQSICPVEDVCKKDRSEDRGFFSRET